MIISRKYLFIKKSKLPDAGNGLFTRILISKGDRIVEYKGRRELWKNVKHTDGYNGYLFRLDLATAINAEPYKKALGRFVNDASGLTRVKGLRNNAEYNIYGDRCYIEAIRSIKKGDEILASYGKEYWDLIRKIREEKRIQKNRNDSI
jgi:SET domain-containing protein